MVPRARVVVYHILPDGEVVADALDFDVLGTFQNTVSRISVVSYWRTGTLCGWWMALWMVSLHGCLTFILWN